MPRTCLERNECFPPEADTHSPDAHRAKISQTVSERSPLAGLLGLGALTAFTSTYHALGVASYTTVNGRVVSIGALGQVFVLSAAQDSVKKK